MKVLVTGAGSLLLGGVAAALHARGDEVVVLQRRTVSFAGSDDVQQVLADVRDQAAVQRAATGCDAIVHGAAKVGVVGTWTDFESVNVQGAANVLHAARAAGVSRVVHVSTPSVAHSGSSIVGAGADRAVVGRRSAYYAESKAIAEQAALQANSDDLGVVAIRPPDGQRGPGRPKSRLEAFARLRLRHALSKPKLAQGPAQLFRQGLQLQLE